MNIDELYMRQAINLALRGSGFVASNPLVGAVIVKNGKIIGRGYHKKFGGNHAEIEAINDAQKNRQDIKGATIYVNLEPCAHHGKTPPCAERITKEGISKVVIGIKDPNPLVNGQGTKLLKKSGIEVIENVLMQECEQINESFIYYITHGLPFVSMKSAVTLNGKIGEVGKKVQISSDKSLVFSHELRQKYDAILVGKNTVKNDNPRLTTRLFKNKKKNSNPLRIILDPNCELNSDYQVFNDNNYLIFVDPKKLISSYLNCFKAYNIIPLVIGKNGQFIIKNILKQLADRKITSVLVEGGAKTYAAFLEQRIVQKGYFFICPHFLTGRKAISLLPDESNLKFDFKINRKIALDNDIMVQGYFSY